MVSVTVSQMPICVIVSASLLDFCGKQNLHGIFLDTV